MAKVKEGISMDCPKCGCNMEKGCIAVGNHSRLHNDFSIEWYSKESMDKYSKFPAQLFLKSDLKIYGKRLKIDRHGFEAYRCKECGAVLVIPPENDENV